MFDIPVCKDLVIFLHRERERERERERQREREREREMCLSIVTFSVVLLFQPQNILFTKPFPDGDIKVCDLGFACLVNTGEDIRDIIGTPDYVG
mgnify:CR=1 FL=1